MFSFILLTKEMSKMNQIEISCCCGGSQVWSPAQDHGRSRNSVLSVGTTHTAHATRHTSGLHVQLQEALGHDKQPLKSNFCFFANVWKMEPALIRVSADRSG